MSNPMAPDYTNPKHRNPESPQKELTVITLQIELPKNFADGLSETFWNRLELIISSMFRLNQPRESDLFPTVWKVS